MPSMKTSIPRKRDFGLLIIVYFTVGIFLLNIYKYHINTDAPSYIAIAEKYANGYIYDAINGLYAPLISWLMIPFALFNIDLLWVFKFISLLAGVPAFFLFYRLFVKFGIPHQIAFMLLIPLIPIFYAFSLLTVNPDFLVAVILLSYLTIVIAEYPGISLRGSMLSGTLGAMAYFAKGYAFPFFILHFSFINFIPFFSTTDRATKINIARNYLLGMIVFAVITSPWIFLLSQKYGALTISKAGTFNLRLSLIDWQYHPTTHSGFLPPTDPIATSAWDEPSFMPMDNFESVLSYDNLVKIAGRNIFKTMNVIQDGTVFAITIILISILHLVGAKGDDISKTKIILLVFTFFLYPIGYLPLLIVRRYIYINIFILYVLGAYLIYRYYPNKSMNQSILMLVLCLSFLNVPVRDLYANRNAGRAIYDLSIALRENKVHGNIGSNSRYDSTLFVAFFTHSKFYGVSNTSSSDTELLSDLEKFKISYYFCWDNQSCPSFLSKYPEITNSRFKNLKIYKLTYERQ